jgi:hypothetical protein
MTNITGALLIVLSVNVILFLAQAGMTDINPTGTKFFNCSGTIISEFDTGNCQGELYLINSDYASNNLPEGEESVSPETGNFFTDIFNTAKNWILGVSGVTYLINIVSAPASFLASLGLPSAFVFAIGSLWYGLTFFLVIAWILGKEG